MKSKSGPLFLQPCRGEGFLKWAPNGAGLRLGPAAPAAQIIRRRSNKFAVDANFHPSPLISFCHNSSFNIARRKKSASVGAAAARSGRSGRRRVKELPFPG